MPPVFKALTTITAWTLFILGWLMLMIGGIIMPAIGGQFSTVEPPPWPFHAAWLGSVMTLILSVCAMKLRQMLE